MEHDQLISDLNATVTLLLLRITVLEDIIVKKGIATELELKDLLDNIASQLNKTLERFVKQNFDAKKMGMS